MTHSGTIFTVRTKAFRSFRDETAFEVRPLTLLYGFNQAGKSTLLRLLPLLAESIQPHAGPLALSCPAVGGASLKEMGWLGKNPNMSPKITIEASCLPSSPNLTIQFTNDNGLLVNRLKIVSHKKEVFSVDYQKMASRNGKETRAIYTGTCNGIAWTGELRFNTMLPSGLPENAKKIVKEIHCAIKPLERLQWLQANRITAQPHNDRNSLCCHSDGTDLPDLLNNQEGQEQLKKISGWLQGQDGLGNEISIRPNSAGHLEFIHGAQGREQLPLFLAGEGIRSLLPIIACACWAENKNESAPSMLAVEEIEAHLHPTVQVALFDRLIETVRTGIPIALETHSVYLLRAMQLAVLEGRLLPEDISLYWIEQAKDSAATASRIEIRPDATLVGWRPDIFEKEQELAHRILDLRWTGKK
jgi:hypothetical protein